MQLCREVFVIFSVQKIENMLGEKYMEGARMVTGTVYLQRTWHRYPGGLLVKVFWRRLPKHIFKNFLVGKNKIQSLGSQFSMC